MEPFVVVTCVVPAAPQVAIFQYLPVRVILRDTPPERIVGVAGFVVAGDFHAATLEITVFCDGVGKVVVHAVPDADWS